MIKIAAHVNRPAIDWQAVVCKNGWMLMTTGVVVVVVVGTVEESFCAKDVPWGFISILCFNEVLSKKYK